MKNVFVGFIVVIITLISFPLFAAEHTGKVHVTSIIARGDGHHNIRTNGALPDMGCTLTDRAIIVGSDFGAKTEMDVALAAYLNFNCVAVAVDGCVAISADQPQITAPRVVRLQLLSSCY